MYFLLARLIIICIVFILYLLEIYLLRTDLEKLEYVSSLRDYTYYPSLIISILTSIVFIIWFYREYFNTKEIYLPNKVSYHPTLAIFSFFIPILNLFIPLKIMDEITDGYIYTKKLKTDAITQNQLNAWWFSYIIYFGLGRLTSNSNGKQLSLEELNTKYILYEIAAIFGIISLYFLIGILRKLKTANDNNLSDKLNIQ